jgi:dihydroflavonol-4-reductase
MKVLVTGATGFVGQWLTKRLVADGYDVRILCRTQPKVLHSNVEVAIGDVTNLNSLIAATKNVHTVFHLAGVIGYSAEMRQQMILANVVGTSNVIEAIEKSKCSKLVYMSSVVAIGAGFTKSELLNENADFNLSKLNLGYFETKHRAEQLVREATTSGRIQAVMINPSTIYGPGDATKGSRKTQLKVAMGKFPFYTPGGVSVVHISDVIDALIKVWQIGRLGERYIISGENLTIKNLFEIIAEEAHVSPPKIYMPKSIVLGIGKVTDLLKHFNVKGPIPSENAWASVLYHWFDNSKAKKELGLNPKPAKIAIHESVQWMKDNHLLNV